MAEKPYRVEAALSARSTCTISKAKIEKGELRLGSYVSFGGKGSYKWRKLSCITAKQVSNIEKELGGPEHVDGFAELSEDQQAEIMAAFKIAVEPAAAPGTCESKGEGEPPAKKAKVDAAPKAKAKAKGKANAKATAGNSGDLESFGIALAGSCAPPALTVNSAHMVIDLAKAGTWDELYRVLDTQPGLVNERPDVREYAVIHQAAFHGNLDAVKTLVNNYGADPCRQTKSGKSVSDVAEEQGHASVVEFVALCLAARASKSKADLGELTPEKVPKEDKLTPRPGKMSLDATKTTHTVVAQPALTPTVIATSHRAIDLAKNGQWEDLFTLLDSRSDIVNVRPEVRDYAVLHQAAFHGDQGVVDALLKRYGADPVQRTQSGKTALDVAREHGHSEVAAVMEEYSARAPQTGGLLPQAQPAEIAEDANDFQLVQMPDGTWKVSAAADKAAAPASTASAGQYKPDMPQAASCPASSSSSTAAGSTCSPAKPTVAAVDPHFPEAAAWRVHHGDGSAWSCHLTRTGFGGSGQVCILQLLETAAGEGYCVWARWGSSDAKCEQKMQRVPSLEEARAAFQSEFAERTGNRWQDLDTFKPFFGKYTLSKSGGPGTSSPAAPAPEAASTPSSPAASPAAVPVPLPAMSPDVAAAAHKVIDMAKAARWADLYERLDARPELVNVRPEVRELSALHQAAFHGNMEAVATLIDKYGADPAQKTRLGVSPAVIALGQGHTESADFITARLPA